MNLPNILTSVRIILIPLFAYFVFGNNFGAAVAVFAVGGITDALDGFLARRLNAITRLGKFLDPLADKLFVIASFYMLYTVGLLPLWLFGAALSKEVIVVSGYSALYFSLSEVEIEPVFLGKTATTAEIITVLLLLLKGLGIIADGLVSIAFTLTALLIVLSTGRYIFAGINIYRRGN